MKKIISLLVRYVPRKYLQLFSGIGLKAAGLFYMGKKVECPICNHHYKKFLPYGRINSRENALCPNCLSLERHRLIWLYLKEKTNFFSGPLSVLHIAPEHCFIKPFENHHKDKYITADIESPLAKVKMDIHKIPFGDNHFDAILCNHVLEHVKDDIQVMKEFHRVLKPGGWAVLQVPFFNPVPDKTFEDNSITNPREREKIFGQDDHVRKYGKDYSERIRQSGLQAIEDPYSLNFTPEKAFHFGIVRQEIIYKGVKQN
ncbi:MAG TPA: methyltransferase domain-containing protein [Cyclobacteriaceae bacterium]|nr:methyltransferase domain-containing protein [Cyclobacteriaceae bacterium]